MCNNINISNVIILMCNIIIVMKVVMCILM